MKAVELVAMVTVLSMKIEKIQEYTYSIYAVLKMHACMDTNADTFDCQYQSNILHCKWCYKLCKMEICVTMEISELNVFNILMYITSLYNSGGFRGAHPARAPPPPPFETLKKYI